MTFTAHRSTHASHWLRYISLYAVRVCIRVCDNGYECGLVSLSACLCFALFCFSLLCTIQPCVFVAHIHSQAEAVTLLSKKMTFCVTTKTVFGIGLGHIWQKQAQLRHGPVIFALLHSMPMYDSMRFLSICLFLFILSRLWRIFCYCFSYSLSFYPSLPTQTSKRRRYRILGNEDEWRQIK